AYAYQEIAKIPEGVNAPADRIKPWGTGHAILCADEEIDAPFAVINADDCYGADAYKVLYDYLKQEPKNDFDYCMVGYVLENTLTDNGHVARGVCSVNNDGYLTKIDERLRIEKRPEGAAYTEDDGATWNVIPTGTPVSMNMWGFQLSLMKVLKDGFPAWLDENIPLNPMKCEYLLPRIIDDMLNKKECTVTVLHSNDKWYGVTYKEDKQMVVNALKALRDSGKYPQNLWNGK
ncbi:MAG: nucleotidyltransferase, partial [Oscillospiraceae bacterium]